MEIRFKDVSFTYKKINYKEKEVLNNINLKIKKGKITGIVGKNGTGKTTLIELINNSIYPTNGEIFIDKSNKIGVIPQIDEFITETVYEELLSSLTLNDYYTNDVFKRMSDALKMVNLSDDYLFLNINNLSNSEKKKVSIASVLIYNPSVIIFDDPTNCLDDNDLKNIISLIRILKKRFQKTIIIASSNTDFLHKIVDYVFVLYDKKIVLDGEKYEVFTNDNLIKYGIMPPKIIQFEQMVKKNKNIRLGFRDEINDLIKDIYRFK